MGLSQSRRGLHMASCLAEEAMVWETSLFTYFPTYGFSI